MMNSFFPLTEAPMQDCSLSEIAKSVIEKSMSWTELDSPIAFSLKSKECNEGKTWKLTDEEKNTLQEETGWTDKQIGKCTIEDNGTIHYKTDREDLEGRKAENGVKYERKTVEINGIKVEGVFPVFHSVFDLQLPENKEKESNATQFKACNTRLKEMTDIDPKLRAKFSDEQLQEIADGNTPSGYTWHHNETPGKMQLVKTEDHDRTQGGAAHTGGRALWGGGG